MEIRSMAICFLSERVPFLLMNREESLSDLNPEPLFKKEFDGLCICLMLLNKDPVSECLLVIIIRTGLSVV